jgi:hypothetical protein
VWSARVSLGFGLVAGLVSAPCTELDISIPFSPAAQSATSPGTARPLAVLPVATAVATVPPSLATTAGECSCSRSVSRNRCPLTRFAPPFSTQRRRPHRRALPVSEGQHRLRCWTQGGLQQRLLQLPAAGSPCRRVHVSGNICLCKRQSIADPVFRAHPPATRRSSVPP